MPISPRKSEKEEEIFPPKWAQLFSLDGWRIVNKDYETCLGPSPGLLGGMFRLQTKGSVILVNTDLAECN